jgi:hypothetical protein
MFAATEYLRWADKHYGKVLFDLGRSGVFGTDRPMLDIPKNLEDFAAWDTLHMRIAAYNGVAVDEVIPTFGASHALWVAYTSLSLKGSVQKCPGLSEMLRVALNSNPSVLHVPLQTVHESLL